MPCYAVTITPSPHKRIGNSKVCYKNCSHSEQRLLLTKAFKSTIEQFKGYEYSEIAYELTPSTNLIHMHTFINLWTEEGTNTSYEESNALFSYTLSSMIGYLGRHNTYEHFCLFRPLKSAYDIDRWVEYMRKDTQLSFRLYQKQYL